MRYQDLFLEGALYTLQLTFISVVVGSIAAGTFAYFHENGPRIARYFIRAYVEVIRNTPALIQIFIIFFVLPHIGLRIPPFQAAALALSIYFCAYAIEIIRSGLEAIPKSQIEAGFCLGLTRWQVFRHVILVSMMRTIYPAYTSQIILLLLGTSLASQVSAEELFHVAGFVESRTYRNFEVYSLVCAIYLAITLSMKGVFYVAGRYVFRWPI
jgi:polar amino acid transport system permease protein